MKRYVFVVLVLGIALVLSSPFTAFARKANYIVGKAGIYSPTSDLEDMDFDTGFNGQIALGHYFHENFALEVGVGYNRTESDFLRQDWEITTYPVMLTAKGVIPLEKFEVYGGAGIGLYFTKAEATLQPAVGKVDDDDTVFGYHFMVGTNFDISDSVFLGVEGIYIITDDAQFFGDPDGVNLHGFIVTGNIGLRF